MSSTCTALLTLHNYHLVTGPCSFINHSISWGAPCLAATSIVTQNQLYTELRLLCPTKYPLYSWVESACTCGQGALPKSIMPQQFSEGLKPAITCLQVAHPTIAPWCQTLGGICWCQDQKESLVRSTPKIFCFDKLGSVVNKKKKRKILLSREFKLKCTIHIRLFFLPITYKMLPQAWASSMK